jgi:hypothetical protein
LPFPTEAGNRIFMRLGCSQPLLNITVDSASHNSSINNVSIAIFGKSEKEFTLEALFDMVEEVFVE